MSGYIITNGKHIVKCESLDKKGTGVTLKDGDYTVFNDIGTALKYMKSFKVLKNQRICEIKETSDDIKKPEKSTRKHYSKDVRKLVYKFNDGKCQLCGMDIKLEDMTLDHIIPLSMGGVDDVENLQCTCFMCNQLKGQILPDDFYDRIRLIYRYQLSEKAGKRKRKEKLIKTLNKIETILTK